MPNWIQRILGTTLTARLYFGQILIKPSSHGFVLTHRDDESLDQLQTFRDEQDAIEIAKSDDAGGYRPLKTAPNMRHGWRLNVTTMEELRRALDYFYPGRLALFAAWKTSGLQTTPLRDTLERQSGMYRIAAKISDEQIEDVVANFCRSNGGCLRTILWNRDRSGAVASTRLPKQKFDPAVDQAFVRPESPPPATVPLLCQEACNLLVAECRKIVKGESAS
ncbi:MAG TPA: DR2241 family protein [Candidatus Udaeobacter sp.]|nr:DR2241 family protein [Candidatus Udaeobacter sp.]